MNIVIQIKTILFSLLYGFFFSFLIGLNHRFLYHKNPFVRFLISILLVLLATLIYFFLLKRINSAIFHIYEILSIIGGYLLEVMLFGLIAKKKK